MSTLKSSIDKYYNGLKGIKDFFGIDYPLHDIIDFTELKWCVNGTFLVVAKDSEKILLPYNEGNMIIKPLYSVYIKDDVWYIFNNKNKIDKFKMYIENGK